LDKEHLSRNRSHVRMTPGNYYVLEVKDSGQGIDQANRERIFEPFFTTKKKGHGLGLSAVTGILKIHNGGITVQSKTGNGTVFKVYLPVPGHKILKNDDTEFIQPVRKLHILLAEDDEVVKEVASRMLEQAGYEVLQASDGIEALRVFGLSVEPIDVVVTDVIMPHMDGIDLAYKLKEQMPQLPIVLISGYADVSDALDRAHALTF